ncbi:hypothetical protein D3C80_1346930 [compost metagenome]
MHQRKDRTQGELPLKAERQVDHDAAQGQQHAQATLVAQLFTHLRTNKLDSLDHGRVVGIDLLQCFGNTVAEHRIITGHAHQQVGGGAKTLHHSIFEAGLDQLFAHLPEVSWTLVGQLDERTAGKVQTEIEAFIEPAEQRQHGKKQGDAERNVAHTHEVNGT